MRLRPSLLFAVIVLTAGTARAVAQQTPSGSVPLVQPGAPGQPTRTLTKPTLGTAHIEPTEADIKFMQGMIMHHSQAVEMVALMPGRTQDPHIVALGQRISLSQSSELKFMRLWLGVNGHPVADDDNMPGMDMSHGMDMGMPAMPGMLTEAQMKALRNAKGPLFDHLFLAGMIQHHTGALVMVKDLYATYGAGQDAQLFDFTADVEVTQQGEIDTMRSMLDKEKP
jgi:uncharacterized protein (DUF305 family)